MKFYEIPENFDAEIENYEKAVKEFTEGSIPKAKLQSIRVPFGIYEQRQNDKYMMRIRLPGGAVTPDQLVHISNIALKHTKSPLHFTTRQDVQLHDLLLHETAEIMKELKESGLSSRGGGGNTVRNILGSYDTGIDSGEVFDISPYVQALTTRLIAESDSWTLPRKLKIGFSGSPEDKGLATVNDLGFIARKKDDGKEGFSVYIGGGMGRKPKVGFQLYGFIDTDRVYGITRAVKNLFDKYGNRKNKYNARLRFLVEKFGREKFVKLFENEYKKVKEIQYPPLKIIPALKSDTGFIEIPLFLGILEPGKAGILGKIMKRFGEDTLRVMTNQNILIRNIKEKDIPDLVSELKKGGIFYELPHFIARSVACAGAETCRLGICLSRNLLKAIKDKLDKNNFDYSRVSDLSLKVSGCSNTCGHHILADIGFYGIAKRSSGRLLPFYQFVMGGIVHEGITRLAETIGSIPAKNIPSFLHELLRFISGSRMEGEDFKDYLERTGKEKILEIFNKYSYVPPFDENSGFYYDWYDDKLFSLAERSSGECSAGLFDLIELDLKTAEQNLGLAEKAYDPSYHRPEDENMVKNTVLSTCRALLITKGFEPKDDHEAVFLFKEHFIGKHLKEEWRTVTDKYLKNEEISEDEAKGLFNEVKELYNSMDDSLRFPELDETEKKGTGGEEEKDYKVCDFRGIGCPLNFVKTKLVLETLNSGDKLEILIDDGEPIDNVPSSLKEEGHKIIKRQKEDGYWRVLIIKGED